MKTFTHLTVEPGREQFYLRDTKTGSYFMKTCGDRIADQNGITEVAHACNCHDDLLAIVVLVLSPHLDATGLEEVLKPMARAVLAKAKAMPWVDPEPESDV